MLVLGIESTCDETACAVVENGKKILSNVIASQTDVHLPFGGVFPELACRRHIDVLIPVIQTALKEAGISPQELDLIAAARGPGLIGALLIGLNAAKALSYAWNIPFVGVNHVEAHLYAALLPLDTPPLPALGLVISGGHTFLVKMERLGHYQLLGSTQDDAIGEAFDKVASLLQLPYPGGPEIERLALQGDPHRFPFKAGQIKGRPLDFSFSGLKTNVLYTVRGQDAQRSPSLSLQDKADIAASFQEAALGDIVKKAHLASQLHHSTTLYCGGGVSNNLRLRSLFSTLPSLSVHYPPPRLSLDNAAMIAGLGYHHYLRQSTGDPLDLEPVTRIPL